MAYQNLTRWRRSPVALIVAVLVTVVLIGGETGILEVQKETGVETEMRDGVKLISDVYRPVLEGAYPVLLQRTPYDRKGGSADARNMASQGYIVVIQDTRGRYDSEGEFYPFRHESEDGFDTVEWAAALPGSNGKVGMFAAHMLVPRRCWQLWRVLPTWKRSSLM